MSSHSDQNSVIVIDLGRHGLLSQAPAAVRSSLSFHLCERIRLNHGLLIVNGMDLLGPCSFQESLQVQRVAAKPQGTTWCWAIKGEAETDVGKSNSDFTTQLQALS